jgi:hypothetical protein
MRGPETHSDSGDPPGHRTWLLVVPLAGGYTRSLGEGEEEGAMTYTTEDFVRRQVGKLLRVDYRGKCLCSACLVALVSAMFGTAFTKAQIEQAMDNVFASPGALMLIPSLLGCAKCGKTLPCLRG